jgi:hypothetical protein
MAGAAAGTLGATSPTFVGAAFAGISEVPGKVARLK